MKALRAVGGLIALFTGYIGIAVVIGSLWSLAAWNIDIVDERGLEIQTVSGILFLVLVALFYKIKGSSLPEAASIRKAQLSDIGKYALCGIVLNLLLVAVLNLLPSDITADYASNVSRELERSMAFIIILFYAPVLEEILFRGLALNLLKACMNPYAAAAILSLLFGLMHGDPVWFAYASVMGMVFSYIAIRTDSILPSMSAHFAFNATSVVILFL
ncbi:MAG: CPBP family intramembrane metalloprotease [Defluviitaleaceae bacterium]|nr:CPBP family intramembrane metalloprotease [Defluviitaleaceae bacterium]